MSGTDSLGTSLIATLRSDDVISIATHTAELSIDAALVEGLLRDVPVIGTLVSITKVGLNVRDTLFIRKLLKFLRELKDVPFQERQRMAEKLEGDPGYGRSAGEHLIEILEKLDAHRKPEMTARIFAAYVTGRIDARTLHRLNHAVDRLPFYEIDTVRKIHQAFKTEGKTDAGKDTYYALENAGLMYATSGLGGLAYKPSDLCQVFIDLDLDQVGT